MKTSILITLIAMILFSVACTASPVEEQIGLSAPPPKMGERDDVAVELRQCLSQLERHAIQRSALQDDLRRQDVLSSTAFVVLEVTSSGWGGYHYSFLWLDEHGSGRMVTDMRTGRWGQRAESSFPARELIASLDEVLPSGRRIKGSTNSVVDDGPCFFVKLKSGAVVDQFAVYAPSRGERTSEDSERLVNRILDLIDRYSGKGG